MIVVFDVDGVLIDTREPVREAYAKCGIIMPPQAFTQSWTEWLPELAGGLPQATRIHNHKSNIYISILTELPPKVLSPGRMFREYCGAGIDMHAITSGSEKSVSHALEQVGLGFVPVLGYELSGSEKNEIFSRKFSKSGVYVDDNKDFKLTARGWRFVNFSGQPYHSLIEDIWTAARRVELEV
jgi:phosphoglycolate phosphatase-like HAD superfamily hydrolase